MKQNLKVVGFFITLIVIGVVMLRFLSIPFLNPDMTETRLLLTYWPEYLVGMLIVLVCIAIADHLK